MRATWWTRRAIRLLEAAGDTTPEELAEAEAIEARLGIGDAEILKDDQDGMTTGCRQDTLGIPAVLSDEPLITYALTQPPPARVAGPPPASGTSTCL